MVHYMKLNARPFEGIKKGLKTIELRLYDEKRRKIGIGDIIVFSSVDDQCQITVRVLNIHCFESFELLYRALPIDKCGYENVHEARPEDMEEYYSPEEQRQYGVVGIEFQVIKKEDM